MYETYTAGKKLKKLENNTWTHQRKKQQRSNTEKQERNNPENAVNVEQCCDKPNTHQHQYSQYNNNILPKLEPMKHGYGYRHRTQTLTRY